MRREEGGNIIMVYISEWTCSTAGVEGAVCNPKGMVACPVGTPGKPSEMTEKI